MSAFVQVFRCLHDNPIRRHWRQASEKRQGTKSREVEPRRCSGLYGDLVASGVMAVVDWAGPERAGRAAWGDRRPLAERKGVGRV